MVDYITLYAFSTENWNRSPQEIAKIFEAIEFAANTVYNAGDFLKVDVRVLGDLSDDRTPPSLRTVLNKLQERTEKRQKDLQPQTGVKQTPSRLTVNLAVNYGGRRDIASACRRIAQAVQNGTLEASEITEDTVQDHLSSQSIPPPDLIVRTGGEHRLSNFLLWEAAYAELCVSPTLWPDFEYETSWKESLEWYAQRKRNFGGRQPNEEDG